MVQGGRPNFPQCPLTIHRYLFSWVIKHLGSLLESEGFVYLMTALCLCPLCKTQPPSVTFIHHIYPGRKLTQPYDLLVLTHSFISLRKWPKAGDASVCHVCIAHNPVQETVSLFKRKLPRVSKETSSWSV